MFTSSVPYYAPFRSFYEIDLAWQVLMGSISIILRDIGLLALCVSACVVTATLIKKYR